MINSKIIKGIFVLADIYYREGGYCLENLFNDNYVDKTHDHIVLEITNKKIYSTFYCTAELVRTDLEEECEEYPDSQDKNHTNFASSIEELCVVLAKKINEKDDFFLRIFRSRDNGKWVYIMRYEISEYEDYDYDDDYNDDGLPHWYQSPEDSYDAEKAESTSLLGALNNLEKILDNKVKNEH